VERLPRVLVAAPAFPPMVGGAELLAERVATNLEGFRVRVVTLGHPEAARHDAGLGVEVVRTGLRNGDRHSLKVLNAKLIWEAARFRPDVLLSIHVSATPVALVLKALGVPFVQYIYAKEFGVYPRVTGLAMRRADAIVAVSRYTQSLAEGAGAPSDRVHRILPGVDSDHIPERSSDTAPEPMLLTVSRIDEAYKGHDVVLEALPTIRKSVPGASWVVIGDGPLRAAIESAGASLPAGAVRVLGRLDDAKRDEWLERARVFVLPSRVPADLAGGEGFGIAALEASAHGLPVVAGRYGGTADAVVDGETGFLVDPTDPEAVAAAVVRLLRDRDEAERMGAAGRARARQLSWARAGQAVSEVLMSAIASRRRLRRG